MSASNEPTRNQLKGFMLAKCIDYCNGILSEQGLMKFMELAKEKWRGAK